MKISIELTGTSPLLMHNPRMVDPDFEVVRQIKTLTSKRKKTDEDFRLIERLEWFGGMYEDNGIVVQPTSKIRKCLINTARISKQGKMVERALSFMQLNVPLIYDGPKTIDDLAELAHFRSRLSVGVGNKRVIRVRPSFYPWSMRAEGLFIEDAGLNFEDLQRLVDLAGVAERIGDNRVNGYGGFVGKATAL